MGRNRRTILRQREIQKQKAITLGKWKPEPEPIMMMVDPATKETTLVAAQATADADVIKAADLVGVPFSVQMVNAIKAAPHGMTLDDLYNRFPDVKRSSVTARLAEAKKKGKVREEGERIGTSGRTLPILIAQ